VYRQQLELKPDNLTARAGLAFVTLRRDGDTGELRALRDDLAFQALLEK
jgi:hypothetical protein